MNTPAPTLFGLLNIVKPSGITSRRAVDLVWRRIHPQRIGHCGTLDPLATGVLLLAIGQASRLVSYYQKLSKTYRAEFQLGVTSQTDDLEFELVPVPPPEIPTRDQIFVACQSFVGDIIQIPPQYSAVQVKGERAYKLLRKGKSVEIPPRQVHISRIELLDYDYPHLKLDIICGSGTYIRTLGRDIASNFSTLAVMTKLERTAIGPFRIEDAVTFEQLDTFEDVQHHLQKAWRGLSDMPLVTFNQEEIIDIRQGRRVTTTAAIPDHVKQIAALDQHDELRSILHLRETGVWQPRINFGDLPDLPENA